MAINEAEGLVQGQLFEETGMESSPNEYRETAEQAEKWVR